MAFASAAANRRAATRHILAARAVIEHRDLCASANSLHVMPAGAKKRIRHPAEPGTLPFG